MFSICFPFPQHFCSQRLFFPLLSFSFLLLFILFANRQYELASDNNKVLSSHPLLLPIPEPIILPLACSREIASIVRWAWLLVSWIRPTYGTVRISSLVIAFILTVLLSRPLLYSTGRRICLKLHLACSLSLLSIAIALWLSCFEIGADKSSGLRTASTAVLPGRAVKSAHRDVAYFQSITQLYPDCKLMLETAAFVNVLDVFCFVCMYLTYSQLSCKTDNWNCYFCGYLWQFLAVLSVCTWQKAVCKTDNWNCYFCGYLWQFLAVLSVCTWQKAVCKTDNWNCYFCGYLWQFLAVLSVCTWQKAVCKTDNWNCYFCGYLWQFLAVLSECTWQKADCKTDNWNCYFCGYLWQFLAVLSVCTWQSFICLQN